jgi:sulfate/thiosulfate transport system substrate-binding protein
MKRLTPILALLALLAVLVAAGCGGQSSSASGGGGNGGKLALVAYSTPQEAYEKIIPAFQKTSAGKGVSFSQSYGASGDQERAVEAGLPADVVALSLEPDVTKLVKKGVVTKDWNADPYHGMVTDSIVVFAVRKGNPKHIKSWADIVKPGVDVISPNPFTSGGAKWNISAAYGAQLEQGRSPAQALDYLGKLFKNVSVLDKSAREALSTFTSGKGDVLISYESEAISAVKAGDAVQYVIPKQTLLIETPIAVTSKSPHQSQAQAFVNWLWSPAGQTIWAKQGYRPVVKSVADQFTSKFPTPPKLFTIKELGGWSKVKKTFFDPATGSITKIEQAAGVPTASS